MRAKFSLNVKALSINSMYYNNRNHGKTADAKAWTAQVCAELNRFSELLAKFRETFDSSKHAYVVHLEYETPKMFNAKGVISAQSLDISNWEKPLIDLIFIESNYGDGIYQSLNLNTDDRFITTLVSRKKYGLAYKINVTLKLIKAPSLSK
jgi:hypothetical protein